MMPPNMPGRCGAIGAAGWLNERDGLDGVEGVAGDGRAGDENDREPRLPPPEARAQASAVMRTRPNIAIRLVMAKSLRVFTWHLPAQVGFSSLYPLSPATVME
jgi:hypothetical protein